MTTAQDQQWGQTSSLMRKTGNIGQRQYSSTLYVCIWFIVVLVGIDIAINLLFAYPQSPKVLPSRLQSYFEYGRSTEGQLWRMTRAEKSNTAPITLAGWYDPLEVKEFPPKKTTNPIVTIYGASHSVNLATALSRVSDRFTPRSVGAPGATSNWAYGAYLRDKSARDSYAIVLTFQSSTLPMITTLSPMTWNVDAPIPYTADRFFVDNGTFRVIHPPYTSFSAYLAAFFDPKQWSAARAFFAKHDALYNSVIFRETFLDHSSLFRLAHRAYGQHITREVRHAVLDQSGFQPGSEAIRVARAIIHEFALQTRQGGQMPVIFLINDLGYSNYLLQALRPTLDQDHIPYLSSDSIVSPNDPRGYLPDGHFTKELDDRLASALDLLLANGDDIKKPSHN
jgi:hypothetical protein